VSADPGAGGIGDDPFAGGPGEASGPGGPGGGPGAGAQPSEEELRAAYEAELARITSSDMMLQAAVSLLNIASFRLAPRPPAGAEGAPPPGGGQDLEQVRDAIDGVRALLEILERRVPSELRPLREALSQLQMAYAREVGPGGDGSEGGGSEGGPGGGGPGGGGPEQPPAGGQDKPGPGPAESSGRLWVPGR
jgi:hypothetical protein